MNRNCTLSCSFLLSSLALAGVTRAAAPEVIARGGNIELSSAEVRQMLAEMPDTTRKAAATDLATLEQLLRGEITARALLDEARSAGFDRDPNAHAQLERVRDEALLRLWIASRAQVPATFPSAAELQAAYDANKTRLSSGAEYHLAQIFVAAPDGADTQLLSGALRKVSEVGVKLAARGADFQKLATEYSDHAASAPQGGDLGFLPENRLLPEVVVALQKLSPGEVAGPIKTAQGLHFVKLLEIRPARVPTLAEVQDQLKSALRTQRAQELQQVYLDEAGRKLGIVVNQVELAQLRQSLQ